MQRGQSNVVPKLNLKKDTFASKSAPNSARSNQADPSNRDHQLEKDEKYLAWRRRKEYRPTSGGRSKAPLKMTKSLTIGSKMRENSITLTNTSVSNTLTEEENLERNSVREKAEDELTVLDELVIDTSLNISNKICTSAIDVLLRATKKFSVSDQDVLMNVETLSYILEDCHIDTNEKQKQLSALLKNLKKLDHALVLTDRIIHSGKT